MMTKSALPRLSIILILLFACSFLRAQDIGQLSGSLTLTIGSGSTSSTNPEYKIVGISVSEEAVYVGAVSSVSLNDVTFATETDLEGNSVNPFTAGVLATKTVRATATVNGSGVVTGIAVVSGGSNFTSAPTVVIDDPTGNSAPVTSAEATAVLDGDEVDSFTVTNGGTNYSSANPPGVTVDSGPHFLRLTSGTNEGRFFLIASNTATTITIDTSSLANGESNAAALISANDTVEVVRGMNLGDAFGVTDAAVDLTGGVSFFNTDWIYLWNSDAGSYIPYFFNDGTGSKPAGWYDTTNFFATEPDDPVIAPDESLIIARRNTGAVTLSFDGALLTTDTQLTLPAAGKRFLMNNPFGADVLLTELIPNDSIGTSSTKFYADNDHEGGDNVYVLDAGVWYKYYHKATNTSVTEVATCTAVRVSGGAVASAYLAYPPNPASLSSSHKCTITGVTNPAADSGTPANGYMTITTGAAHSLQADDVLAITGVVGYKTNDDNSKYVGSDGTEYDLNPSGQSSALEIESSANGTWTVYDVPTPSTFRIAKSGNAVYKEGGYWATGSGGAGYSGTAAVYFIGNGVTKANMAYGTGVLSGDKVDSITITSGGSTYGSTVPQAIFSSGGWREKDAGTADMGNFIISGGAGILISRHASHSGVKTYLKTSNPVK